MKRLISGKEYALDISKLVWTNGIAVDQPVISQSIENILMTGYKERVMMSNYGSFLPSYLFENLTMSTADQLLTAVINLIKKWENRIYIVESQCRITLHKPAGYLELSIAYYNIVSGTSGIFNKRIVF